MAWVSARARSSRRSTLPMLICSLSDPRPARHPSRSARRPCAGTDGGGANAIGQHEAHPRGPASRQSSPSHHQYQRPDPRLNANPATHATKNTMAAIHRRCTANPKPTNRNASKSASTMNNTTSSLLLGLFSDHLLRTLSLPVRNRLGWPTLPTFGLTQVSRYSVPAYPTKERAYAEGIPGLSKDFQPSKTCASEFITARGLCPAALARWPISALRRASSI